MVDFGYLEFFIWESKENQSVEYFSLSATLEGFVLKRYRFYFHNTANPLITYAVNCSEKRVTKDVSIHRERAGKKSNLTLKQDDQQVWFSDGALIAFATGLLDVDLEFSPATNTLPIRRLNLAIGESRVVDSVWVRSDKLTLERLKQKYSRLDDNHYEYETLSFDFKATIQVDKGWLSY